MKVLARIARLVLLVTSIPIAGWAKPQAKPTRRAPAVREVPVGPLPMLPSIARVRLEVLENKLVVVEEVNLPRGDWRSETLNFYVAFGAPGTPRALDAQLLPIGDGLLESDDAATGDALTFDPAPRRPASAYALLGRESMAGVVVHIKREAFEKALKPGNMAALRIRTALDLPDEDAEGGRSVVVRLGSSRGSPLTLGRVSLVAKPGSLSPARAEAHLCGPDADRTPLAIALTPKPSSAPQHPAPIAPVLAVRHASDDLCVRFWAS